MSTPFLPPAAPRLLPLGALAAGFGLLAGPASRPKPAASAPSGSSRGAAGEG
jgi:hypothetical protein